MSGINLGRGSSYNQEPVPGPLTHIMLQFPLAGNLININNGILAHMLLIIAKALRQVSSNLIANNNRPKVLPHIFPGLWSLLFIISHLQRMI